MDQLSFYKWCISINYPIDIFIVILIHTFHLKNIKLHDNLLSKCINFSKTQWKIMVTLYLNDKLFPF